MNTIIIIGLLLLGGGVAIYKFKASPKASAKKPAKKAKKAIISAEEKNISREEVKAGRPKRRSKRNTKLPK